MSARAFRLVKDGAIAMFGHRIAGDIGVVFYVVGATIVIIVTTDAFYGGNYAAGWGGLAFLVISISILEVAGWSKYGSRGG